MSIKSRRVGCLVLISALVMLAGPVYAQQNYPDRPIRIITLGTSGGTDLIARFIADGLTKSLKQQVVVEARPGASGQIAASATARAAPDGYTLLLTFYGVVIDAAMKGSELPYDVIRDFSPITQVTASSSILTVSAGAPPKNLKEFIAWVKAYQGNLNVGAPGQGSGGYLAAKLFDSMAGVKAQIIPHNGSAPALFGVVKGDYQYAFTSADSAAPLMRNGQLRGLALSGSKRSATLPDIPIMAEELPGFAVDGWWGVVGPGKMPKPIVNRLHDEIVRVITSPDIGKKIAEGGGEVIASTPEEFAKVIADDLERYKKLLK